MGLKEVKDEIVEEAREEAKEIRRKAEEEATEIREEAETEAEKIKSEARDEVNEEKESLKKRKLSNARMEAKEQKLEGKQDKIDEVFERFRSRLRQMSEGEKAKYADRVAEKTEFEVGRAEASEDFAQALRDQGLEVEEIDRPGVVLISKDGERRKDYTLERLANDFKNRKRKQVAEVLFE